MGKRKNPNVDVRQKKKDKKSSANNSGKSDSKISFRLKF